jgi:hypothetical protein
VQELWNIKKFRAKYGVLMQQYYDNKVRNRDSNTITVTL